MSRGLNKMFDTLRARGVAVYESAELRSVKPGRLQILEVDNEISIKACVLENGLAFKTGHGFYEFTKTETIPGKKEIVLMERSTGDLFEGKSAR